MLVRYILLLSLFYTGCSDQNPRQEVGKYLDRSDSYMQQGQYRAAMIEARNALKKSPGSTIAKLQLAKIYNTVGAPESTARLLKNDLASTKNEEAALLLAEAYLQQGKSLSAEESLTAVVVTDTNRRRYDKLKADISLQGKNFKEAREAFERLLAETESPDVIEGYINSLVGTGESDAAREKLASYADRYPRSQEILYLQGRLAYLQGNLDNAERYFSEALYSIPSSDLMVPQKKRVLRMLATVLTRQGRTNEATVYTKLLAESNPSYAAEQQLSEALAAIAKGEIDKAESIVEVLRETYGTGVDKLALVQGILELKKGELQSAADLFSESLDVETTDPAIVGLAIRTQLQAGKRKEVVKQLDRAIRIYPDNASLLALHGMVLLELPDRAKEGVVSIEKALARYPDQVYLRGILAQHYGLLGLEEQSMAQLHQAFKTKPDEWKVTQLYVNNLLAKNNLQDAWQVVSKLLQKFPDEENSYLMAALVAGKQGDQDKKRVLLQELRRRHPQSIPGLLGLAVMRHNQGKIATATDMLEKILLIKPTEQRALSLALKWLDPKEMTIWLEKLGNQDRALIPTAMAGKTLLALKQQGPEQAVSIVDNYEGETNTLYDKVRTRTYLDYARDLADSGRTAEGRAYIQKLLEVDPSNKALNLLLISFDVKAKNYQAATSRIVNLEDLYPDDIELIRLRTGLIKQQYGLSDAFAYLNECNQRLNNMKLAGLLFKLATETTEEALIEESFTQWVALSDDKPIVPLLAMAKYRHERGEIGESIDHYLKALKFNPDHPQVLNNLAWLLRDTDKGKALSYAKRAAEIRPSSGSILDTYGWLLFLNGQRQEALNQLQKAAQLEPDNHEIVKHLESVKSKQG